MKLDLTPVPEPAHKPRRKGPQRTPYGVRGVPLAVVFCLSLAISSCTLELLQRTSLVAPGEDAVYTLEIFNDEIQNTGTTAYTVAHIPSAWSLTGAAFASTGVPATGFGTVVADPGFVCTFGPDQPAPGAGRKAVFVRWGVFDIVNPQSVSLELSFNVGPGEGTFEVDFFLVAVNGPSTVCVPPKNATTRVASGAIFGDGFENGDLSAWSGSSP